MSDYRGDFPDFGSTIYLDCAYQGVFPRRAVEAAERAIQLKCRPETLAAAEYFNLPDRVRGHLARLTGADADEIALTNSATQGVGAVACGLNLGPVDEVVVASSNFPSNLFTWLHLRRLGVRVNVIPCPDDIVSYDAIAGALSARTRVLALDWVSYSTGALIDLAALGELARRRGALFVVDGSQGAGALELDLGALPVDAFAAAAYKWLLGPYGTGFVYLSRELQSRLDLPVINWLSVEGAGDFDALPKDEFTLVQSARVFDVPETGNFLNLYPLEASLNYLEGIGVSRVHGHCARLLVRLAEGLARQGYRLAAWPEQGPRSAILSFRADSLEATAALHQRLRAHHLAVSLRQGNIRVSPYLYNTAEQMDRLLEIARPGGATAVCGAPGR